MSHLKSLRSKTFFALALIPLVLSGLSMATAGNGQPGGPSISRSAADPGSGLARRRFLDEGFVKVDDRVKVAFFDVDSTLRVSLSGSVSANHPKDVLLLPFVAQKIAELKRQGYLIALVSNQGGVASGHVTIQEADQALLYTTELLKEQDPEAVVHYYDFAEASDEFRKPETGMAKLLEQQLKERALTIDWSESFMVGDSAYKRGVDTEPSGLPGIHFSNSDRIFAEKLKIRFFDPTDFFGWRSYGVRVFDKAEEVRKFLSELNGADATENRCESLQ